jgi:four helix bundle protein
MSSSFRDLRVWQDALKLTIETYRRTAEFPKHEIYGLSQQMRRAAVSVPSNIAEGKGRRTNREFAQFLFNARGSLLELQTQVIIAQELGYISEKESRNLLDKATQVGRGLAGLIHAVQGDSRILAILAKDQRPTANDHV